MTIENEAVVGVRRSPGHNLGFRQLLLLNGPTSTLRLCMLDPSLTVCPPGIRRSDVMVETMPTLCEVSLAPDLEQFGSRALQRLLKVQLLAL